MSDFRFPVPVFVATNEGVVCDYVADFGLYDRYVLPLEGDFQGAPVRLVSLFIDNSANADSLLLAFGKREVIVPPFVSGWTAILKASAVTFACSNSAKVPIRISSSKENFEWSVAGQDNTSFECTVPVAESIKAGDLVTFGDDNLARFAIESSPHALKGIRSYYRASWMEGWTIGQNGNLSPMPDSWDSGNTFSAYPRLNEYIFYMGYYQSKVAIWKLNKYMEQVGFYCCPESVPVLSNVRNSSSSANSYFRVSYTDTENNLHLHMFDLDLHFIKDFVYKLPAPAVNWSVIQRTTFNTDYELHVLYDGNKLFYVKTYWDGANITFQSFVEIDTPALPYDDVNECVTIAFYNGSETVNVCLIYPLTTDGVNKSLNYIALAPLTDTIAKGRTAISTTTTTGYFRKIRAARALTNYGLLCCYTDTGAGKFYWRTGAASYGALTTRITLSQKAGTVSFAADGVVSVNFDSTMYHGVVAVNETSGSIVLKWYNSSYVLQSTVVLALDAPEYVASDMLGVSYTDSNDFMVTFFINANDNTAKVCGYSITGEYFANDLIVNGMYPVFASGVFAEGAYEYYQNGFTQLSLMCRTETETFITGFVSGVAAQYPLGVARKDSFVDTDGIEKVVLQVDGMARLNRMIFPPVVVDGRTSGGNRVVVCGDNAKMYGFV